MFRAHVLIVRRAKLVFYSLWYHHTYRWPSRARDGHLQSVMIPETVKYKFCPPDDEHMCSKHVEVWNKLIIKFSATSWLILINKQQMLIYRHVQSSITILHWHVSVTSVIVIIRVYYNNNTINIQTVVQKGMIKLLDVAMEILYRSLWSRNIELSLQRSKIVYVCVVYSMRMVVPHPVIKNNIAIGEQ